MAKEWFFMLAKHCLQEFKLDCQLRRLSDRTIKGYYNNTLNFLIYAEKHHEVTEVEEIRTFGSFCILTLVAGLAHTYSSWTAKAK